MCNLIRELQKSALNIAYLSVLSGKTDNERLSILS